MASIGKPDKRWLESFREFQTMYDEMADFRRFVTRGGGVVSDPAKIAKDNPELFITWRAERRVTGKSTVWNPEQ